MNEVINQSAVELVSQIKSGKISVVEVVTAFLDQIKCHNSKVNAIFELRAEDAILEEAREKDREVKAGQARGLLFGLPLTVKDSFLVRGLKNSNGDPLLRNYVAEEDAELVRRMKKEGALIIGKTNVALFCIDWQSTNFWNGQSNNPYNLSRVAGGSSGGSAVSVASRFSPLELGADAGGSVRVPAHFNGICGLRPTENYLSNRGHLKAPGRPQGRRHIVTPGPFAKNVEDLMLMMQVLGDNVAHQLPELPYVDFDHSHWDGSGLRVAYSETINDVEIDQEYSELFHAFIEKLKASVHQFEKDEPAFDEKRAYVECTKIQGFELGVNSPWFPLRSLFMYLFILLKYKDHLWAKGMASGLKLSNTAYAKAIDYKDHFSEIYNRFLTKYDVWITPVCCFESFKHQRAGVPFKINDRSVPYTKAIASYTFTTAFSGHPIAVIPIGTKENGMPVGVQIHSRKWTDKRLLEIAKHFEQYTDEIDFPTFKNTL